MALSFKPTTEELALGAARPTESVDAYDLYLRGRAAIRNQRSVQTLQSAMNLYNEALKKDPGFALAYCGLADAYLDLYQETKDSSMPEKALGAAQQAEQLARNKPEVHFSMGSVYLATGKTSEAIVEFKQALALAPNSDEGYRRLGSAWVAAGRKDEALTAYQLGVDLNPYYWLNDSKLGHAALTFGENDKALAAYQQVTQLVPNRERVRQSWRRIFSTGQMGRMHSRFPESHGDRTQLECFLQPRHSLLLPAALLGRNQSL